MTGNHICSIIYRPKRTKHICSMCSRGAASPCRMSHVHYLSCSFVSWVSVTLSIMGSVPEGKDRIGGTEIKSRAGSRGESSSSFGREKPYSPIYVDHQNTVMVRCMLHSVFSSYMLQLQQKQDSRHLQYQK
jgi:hypothetical protein